MTHISINYHNSCIYKDTFTCNSLLAFFLSNEYFDWKKYAILESSQKKLARNPLQKQFTRFKIPYPAKCKSFLNFQCVTIWKRLFTFNVTLSICHLKRKPYNENSDLISPDYQCHNIFQMGWQKRYQLVLWYFKVPFN